MTEVNSILGRAIGMLVVAAFVLFLILAKKTKPDERP